MGETSAYATHTRELVELADGEQDLVEEALCAGAAEIDAALMSGGYQAPADLSDLTQTEQDRWNAWLTVCNRVLAAVILSSGSSDAGASGQSTVIRKDAERCKKILDRVAQGEIRLPFPALPASESVGLFVAGDQRYKRAQVEAAFDGLDVVRLLGTESLVNI